DVVYNHTGEAGVDGPTCLFRGFDNLCYYHHVEKFPRHYDDYTGCGNSVAVYHPRTLRLVMDSLRYWVEEMHVDGFRFDLAVEMGRSPLGYSRRAAFFQALHQDPILNQTKLIAEPWDLGLGGYQVGNFPTDWAELNGKFRDCVREFWRGESGVTGEFAARITGSEDMYSHNRRTPGASINFVTSHDGFTLADLVSYNEKHNLANGENNRDGESGNHSDNHGVEGPTDDPEINRLRLRQIRNFLTTLITSQGVPFILFGDERLRTQRGNNNGYCQDNEISWVHWNESEDAADLRQFCGRLLAFRKERASLRRESFFTGEIMEDTQLPDVCWLRPDGAIKQSKDWNQKKNGAFAMLIHSVNDEPGLLFLFNPTGKTIKFTTPEQSGKQWRLIVDTDAPEREGDKTKSAPVAVVDHSMQIWETC
ncbi:MAG: glycogen debranching enzyme, partial [Verrucomicrobiota bacterium]